jgi:hypothetical protein
VNLRALILLTLACSLTACETDEPVTLLNGCLAPGIKTVLSEGGSMEISCETRQPVLLVGLPNREVTPAELTDAGVPKSSIDLLISTEIKGSRWCTVESSEARPPAASGPDREQQLVVRVRCGNSSIDIPKVQAALGTKFVIEVAAADGKTARLVRISGVGAQ